MVFERLLKLSVFGKITVEKFRDFGVLFESGIRMTREAHALILCIFLSLDVQNDRAILTHFYMLCKDLNVFFFFGNFVAGHTLDIVR